MANDLVVSAKTVILALPLKALAAMKVSAESVTVARWESPALVLDPFGVLLERFCTWKDAIPMKMGC